MEPEDPQERPDTALGAGSEEGGQSDDVDREHVGQQVDAQGRLHNSRGQYMRRDEEKVVDEKDDDVNDDASEVEERSPEGPTPQQIKAFLGALTEEGMNVVKEQLNLLSVEGFEEEGRLDELEGKVTSLARDHAVLAQRAAQLSDELP